MGSFSSSSSDGMVVAAVVRPPWLAAVVGEYGVATVTATDRSSTAVVAEALARYR